MRFLRQSTSVDAPIGPFLDDIDGKTAETALTITQPDVRLKKNGAVWAQKAAAQTLTHEENGYYEVTLDATDTDTLGLLRLAVHETGALPVWEEFMVMPANVWDSLFGADALQVDVAQWLGTAAATPTVAGVPEVDVTHVGGTVQTAGDIIGDTNDLQTKLGTPLNLGSGATVAANLVDIEAQTDDIGAAGAGLTAVPWNAAWDAEVQSEVADALDAAIPASPTAGSVNEAVRNAVVALVIRRQTAQAGAATTITLDAGASASDDFFNNTYIVLVAGTGVGQARFISDYVGATKLATVNTAWITNPDATSVFEIVAFSTVADAVWDEASADHISAGSTGERVERLDLLASGGTGGLTNARAVNLDNLDATVSSRSTYAGGAVASVTGAVGSVAAGGITAASFGAGAIDNAAFNVTETLTANPASGGIVAASFGAGAIDAAALATDAVNEIADGLLDRNMATGTDSGSPTVRTMRQALRFLRNKFTVVGTALTVTKEDDVTTSWTGVVTTDAAATPITGNDPASA